ncbi:MAG TPA: GNAT family N-acyltransferase [Rhodopila sp.]
MTSGTSAVESVVRPFAEIRSGNLGVRITADAKEIDALQALRYRVFYQEMGARPDAVTATTRRDRDIYDTVADHLLVVDHSLGEGAESVVGTYRLIQRHAASQIGHFYSSDEYDISRIEACPGPILELGRSCVDNLYRNRAVMQLLWRGIAAYVFQNKIELMFGCASLPGTDPDAIAAELTYLYRNHLAPDAIRPRALPDRYIDMCRLGQEDIDIRAALTKLPPLLKGYLRLGGFIGDGAVVDPQFNTTDVAVVVQTDLVTDKYSKHYELQRRETSD